MTHVLILQRDVSEVLDCAKEWHKITHNHNFEHGGVFKMSMKN